MSFFLLFRREMQGSLGRLVVMSALGGDQQCGHSGRDQCRRPSRGHRPVEPVGGGAFVVSLLLFVKTQHYILISATVEIEAIIHKVRVRLMDLVRQSELVPLDAIGRSGIVGAITRETATLTQATNTLAFAVQGVVLIFFVRIYVAYLSLLAFVLAILVVGVAAALFHAKSHQVTTGMREASDWENRLFERLIDLLNGFKEVRLNRKRSEDLFDDIVEVSRTAANIKIKTQSEVFRRLVFSQSSMYVLLGAVAFAVPVFNEHGEGAARSRKPSRRWCSSSGRVRPRAVDTDFDRRQYCRRPHRAPGDVADGDDRRRGGRRCRTPKTLQRDRRAQHRIPLLVDKWSGGDLQIGPLDFTLQVRASWFSSPAATARANRPS